MRVRELVWRWSLLAGMVGSVVVLSGCEQKFTRARFDMIKKGVDNRQDVETLLGEPDFRQQDLWFYENTEKARHAQIWFGPDGRVIEKEWIDAKAGTWEGRSPHTDPPPEGEVREEHVRTRDWDD